MLRTRSITSAALLAFTAAVHAGGDPAGAQREQTSEAVPVGVAKVEITPDHPVRLAGYGSRDREAHHVAQKLWAKALAIGGGDQTAEPVVFVLIENALVPRYLTDRVAARLKEEAGLPRARLTVAATHTHTGPLLRDRFTFAFGEPIPPDHRKRIDRYTDRLLHAAQRVALKALRSRKPGRLAWARGEVGFARNRRVIRNGKWAGFGVNPDGPVDHDLPLLAVRSPDGSLRAVLASYAAHPTTFHGNYNRIHGDWAGSAMKQIEQRHPGCVALVALGCAGDQNPQPRGGSAKRMARRAEMHGKAITDEVDRLLSTDMRPLGPPTRCRSRRVELRLQELPDRNVWEKRARSGGPKGYYANHALRRLDRGDPLPSTVELPVKAWAFGDALGLVMLGGEVVVDYSLRLKRELKRGRVWTIAYAGAIPCYIPSRRMMPQGGYEVVGSMYRYGLPTPLRDDTEGRIINAVRELLPARFPDAR